MSVEPGTKGPGVSAGGNLLFDAQSVMSSA